MSLSCYIVESSSTVWTWSSIIILFRLLIATSVASFTSLRATSSATTASCSHCSTELIRLSLPFSFVSTSSYWLIHCSRSTNLLFLLWCHWFTTLSLSKNLFVLIRYNSMGLTIEHFALLYEYFLAHFNMLTVCLGIEISLTRCTLLEIHIHRSLESLFWKIIASSTLSFRNCRNNLLRNFIIITRIRWAIITPSSWRCLSRHFTLRGFSFLRLILILLFFHSSQIVHISLIATMMRRHSWGRLVIPFLIFS